MNLPPPLKHEVALLRGEEVLAPALEELCGGDGLHPEAQRIADASRSRLLRCAVCGAAVKKVFGSSKRWHFALFPNAVPCDHENETVEHRESKLALYRALRNRLADDWSVHLERRLENGRRPDVLAVNENGVRVAFEVQYADLSKSEWCKRHEDYAKLGIRDVWLLGHVREPDERNWLIKRDALASVLAATEGQRIVYIGRRQDDRNVRCQEVIFGSGLPRGELPYARTASSSPGTFVAMWPGPAIAEWVEYGPGAIKLLEDGTLHTPADITFEKLRRRAEWERRQKELRRRADEERRRKEAERRARTTVDAERRRRWGEERRAEEARAWQDSPERAAALKVLGDRILTFLESERSLDKNIYSPAGRWKTAFFLSRVHGRPPGTVFDWFKAAGAVLREHPHNKREGSKWAWAALHDFVDRLAREGLVEFDHHDDRDRTRYWRTPRNSDQRQELLARRAEEARYREEERQEALRDAERRTELEEKWERNRRARERREKAEIEARPAHPPLLVPLNRAQLLQRQKQLERWLVSSVRERARAALGQYLLNRLEREENLDRAVLTHPGEWKVWLFLNYVHDAAPSEMLDLKKVADEASRRFEAVEDPTLLNEAVRLFVLFLRDEGFLAKDKHNNDLLGGVQQRFVVIGTAAEWTSRLEQKIKSSRDASWQRPRLQGTDPAR
ncbi:competence protein CoiA [Rubrobacter indicoceani]|uniref:competence protein CoiA n=1 Tax=Rubrobacter indicoceani TaxID=2051957 RepID=UPI000E5BF143|nr:competence protein CoiA family protein [Rubrobacter indicoceani]